MTPTRDGRKREEARANPFYLKWVSALSLRDHSVRVFTIRLRDADPRSSSYRLWNGRSYLEKEDLKSLLGNPDVIHMREILRTSRHTLTHYEELPVSKNTNMPGDLCTTYALKEQLGLHPNWVKRAALEGVVRCYPPKESDVIPRFSFEEVQAAELTGPSSTEKEDLSVAADLMESRGLWLGEPLALWLASSRGCGLRGAIGLRESANSMMIKKAPSFE